MRLVVIQADLRQRLARQGHTGCDEMVVDVQGTQIRSHLFVPGDDIREMALRFPDVLDFVEEFIRQQVRRPAPAGHDVAVLGFCQTPGFGVGEKVVRAGQKSTVGRAEGIVPPVRIGLFRILAVMLQGHLHIHAVFIRRLKNCIPAPGRVQQQCPPRRIFGFVRRPVQRLAVPECHPHPRPVHVRRAHLLKYLWIAAALAACPGNVHAQRRVGLPAVKNKSLRDLRVAPHKTRRVRWDAAKPSRQQVCRREGRTAARDGQRIRAEERGGETNPPAVPVPESRGGNALAVRLSERDLHIVVGRIKWVAMLIGKRKRCLQFGVLGNWRGSRRGGKFLGGPQRANGHQDKENTFHGWLRRKSSGGEAASCKAVSGPSTCV